MYAYLNREQQAVTRKVLRALALNTAFQPVAIPLFFAVLLGGLAGLAGLSPVDFGLRLLGDAAIVLSGVTVKLWLLCFFAVVLCFGPGRGLPYLLWHRSLSAGLAARFTQSVAIRTSSHADVATLFAGPCRWQIVLTRPSRIALCTASDLAGSTPRLE